MIHQGALACATRHTCTAQGTVTLLPKATEADRRTMKWLLGTAVKLAIRVSLRTHVVSQILRRRFTRSRRACGRYYGDGSEPAGPGDDWAHRSWMSQTGQRDTSLPRPTVRGRRMSTIVGLEQDTGELALAYRRPSDSTCRSWALLWSASAKPPWARLLRPPV
jgi:hypothetical protein